MDDGCGRIKGMAEGGKQCMERQTEEEVLVETLEAKTGGGNRRGTPC
jgi:hypothetical protein